MVLALACRCRTFCQFSACVALRIPHASLTCQTSGSIVDPLNSYLGDLCSAPQCSNSTLSSAESSLQSSCSSDLSGSGTAAAEVGALLAALQNYPEVYTAACSKNTTFVSLS